MMTLDELAARLRKVAAAVKPALAAENVALARIGAEKAKGYIGHLQPGWPELADSTKAEKARRGHAPPDFDPLLRSGGGRDSIHGVGSVDGFVIGTTSKEMAYQELGTAKIPPRPFLSRALFEMTPEEIAAAYARLAMRLITPK